MEIRDRYFFRRKDVREQDFEGAYWGVVKDPDGNIRDRREESDCFLQDAAEEIAFLKGLVPGRVLDIGCGLGFLLSALPDSWERHGVEVSSYAAQYAKQCGTVHVGELADAGYPDDYFDVVVLYHVIEHMLDPVAVMDEVRRILKDGGVLLLATPDFDSGCARRFGERYRLLHDKTHISLFTADSVHRFLRDQGFVIDKVSFPFFETRYFTQKNLLRLFDTTRISPPFYGNFMTFYAHLPKCPRTVAVLQRLGLCGRKELESAEKTVDQMVRKLATMVSSGCLAGIFFAGFGDALLEVALQVFQDLFRTSEVEIIPAEGEQSAPGSCVISFRVEAPTRPDISSDNLVLASEDRGPEFWGDALVLTIPHLSYARWEHGALMVLDALGKDVVSRLKEMGTQEGKGVSR